MKRSSHVQEMSNSSQTGDRFAKTQQFNRQGLLRMESMGIEISCWMLLVAASSMAVEKAWE